MSPAESTNPSEEGEDRAQRDAEFDASNGAQGAPNGQARDRGSRADDDEADPVMPGREFGAGGQIDDGPDPKAGAGGGDEQ